MLNEVERNLQDAMNVTRNVLLEPKLVPGGGAAEMALAYVMTNVSTCRNLLLMHLFILGIGRES